MELVIASHNVHKIREFRAMFKPYPHIDIISLHNFSDYEAPEEVEETFEGNAVLKARHAQKTLNKWVLADDTGLVVPILEGRPGVYSRRYAGEDATDAENRQKLLEELKEKKGLERSAYYECCLALAGPDDYLKVVRGISEGYIIEEEKGRNGFGYDSLFNRHETNKTYAEMSEETKNQISHRAKAVQKMLTVLESLSAAR